MEPLGVPTEHLPSRLPVFHSLLEELPWGAPDVWGGRVDRTISGAVLSWPCCPSICRVTLGLSRWVCIGCISTLGGISHRVHV